MLIQFRMYHADIDPSAALVRLYGVSESGAPEAGMHLRTWNGEQAPLIKVLPAQLRDGLAGAELQVVFADPESLERFTWAMKRGPLLTLEHSPESS